MTDTAANDNMFRQLKKWFKADREHSAEWRREAKEDFAFVAGDQWSEEDRAALMKQMRSVITFNRIHPVISSVSGMEIGGRQETRYIPREAGDAKGNTLLTEANRWFRDNADADDEDSDAFFDACVCGMGWTETTLDFDQDEDGAPKMDAINPLEMFWDKNARKKNVDDATRIWRVRKIPLDEARRMFPNTPVTDFDASWASADDAEGKTQDREQARLYEGQGEAGEFDGDAEVTIVHGQWYAWKDEHTVLDTTTGHRSKMTAEEFATFSKRAKAIGLPVVSTKRKVRIVKQAFLGATLLEQEDDALCPEVFSFRCVTAYRDKAKGTFYGIVRGMKDPQRWANKWMSQALDIINSQSKGGIMMEADAVDDIRQFQADWTRPDKPAIVASGALVAGKIQPKPQGNVPATFFQMMEFAISSVRDVSGVSVEMLGMREANQPASLEYQRRQSGMQILLPLMDNLKRYRRDHGRLMLYLIQNHLSDGRLIRIVGEGQAQFVPLIRQADVKYDIVVDDMPTAPNQKEMIASQIAPLMANLPPPVQMEFLKYMLPDSVGDDLARIMGQMNAPNPKQQMAEQIQAAGAQAKIAIDQATANEANARAQKMAAETALLPVRAQNDAAKAETERFRARGAALDNVAKLAGLAGGGASRAF